MNKNKRAFLSMIVFLSVFFWSAIFYFPLLPIFAEAPENGAINATSDHAELQSFSYGKGPMVLSETDTGLSAEETADTDSIQEDEVISEDTDEAAASDTTKAEDSKSAAESNSDAEITPAPETKEVIEETPAFYADIGISTANNFVNIRKEPSADSESLGKLYKDSAATILKTKGDWYLVESGSVEGYIKSEYLKTGIPDEEIIKKYGELQAVVDVDGLNVRKEPDKEAARVDVIYKNEVYPVLEAGDTWVKINIEDDKTIGYTMREYIQLIATFKEAVSKEEEQELLQLQAEERAKKKTEIKQQESVSYSKEELKLLACLVHAEAGSQSYEGKLAVANVVINRMKSSKYPDTMKAVVYQPGQFTVAKSGSLQKQLDNYANYSSQSQLLSVKAAKAALGGANNIGSRLYFHSYQTAVNKGYDDKETAVKIGAQLFW